MRVVVAAALCWLLGLLAPLPAEAADTGAAGSSDGLSAYVSVAGAPGDGEQALAAALTRRLSAIGVKEATAFEANAYDVQGTVRVTPAPGGKETVTIVWVVFGPDGNQLGVLQLAFVELG